MGAGGGSWMEKPGLVRTLVARARLGFRLIREPAVPLAAKAIPLLGGLYLIWPLDFLPDLFPILGQLDDLGILLAALEAFLHLCPEAPATFHRDALAAGRRYTPMPPRDGFVDAEFRRE